MTASSSRMVALKAVSRIRERSSFAHETVDALLEKSGLDARDAAFASRLALGTVGCRGTLDAAIARHLSPDVVLEPAIADCLATSAYEILHMRTPARAAVNEGVELVRSARPRAVGLANAVLRRLAEDAPTFPWGDPDTDDDALSRLTGHPLWLTTMLISEYGRDAAVRTMMANNEPAPLYVAIMRDEARTVHELREAGADPEPGPVQGCYVLRQPRAAVLSGILGQCCALVADASAQLAARVVPLSDAHRVVELGAGRGTKTLLMASRARESGLICDFVAVDHHQFKLDVLSRLAERMGLERVTTVNADAGDVSNTGLPPAASADVVLVDAPCSGLGTLRRHPDRRWRAKKDEIDALARLGSCLLVTAASLVKPGGFVVYSTCTVTRAENVGVIEDFLVSKAGEGFGVSPLSPSETGVLHRFVSGDGWFQSLPEPDGPDGHFIARLVRNS